LGFVIRSEFCSIPDEPHGVRCYSYRSIMHCNPARQSGTKFEFCYYIRVLFYPGRTARRAVLQLLFDNAM